jgi:hypothetical protein
MAASDTTPTESEQLTQAAGSALAEWGQLEMVLAHLFASLLDDTTIPLDMRLIPWYDERPYSRKAHSMFAAVVSLDTRLDLIGAVIIEEFQIETPLKDIWQPLRARIVKKYKSRHQLAHFVIGPDPRSESQKRYLWPLASVLLAPDSPRLGMSEIRQKEATFREIRFACRWYLDQVEFAKGRMIGPPLPDTELIGRIRIALESPNQPAS